jgi:hypothetical protein
MRPFRRARSALALLSLFVGACTIESRANSARALDSAAVSQRTTAAPTSADSAAIDAVETAMRRVYDGFKTRDPSAIDASIASSGMLYVDPTGIMQVTSPDGTAELMKRCVARSYAMDSVQTTSPARDVVVLTFKVTLDETCGGRRMPSPLYATAVWHQQGGSWKAIAFSATPARGAR